MHMKKLRIFLMSLSVVAVMVSCDKVNHEYISEIIDQYGNVSAIPVVTENPNVACEDLASATGCQFPYSSGRIDYTGGTGGAFGPITWTTDGTYVNWTSTVPVRVAIIVKGGPGARTYFSGCDVCLTSGTGLSAPINQKTGNPYGLSNISICYDLCEVEEELVISVKSWFWRSYDFTTNTGTGYDYTLSTALSTGSYPYSTNDWCDVLGVNPLEESSFPLLGGVGNVTVEKSITAWIITVDLNEGMALDRTYLYVGNPTELTGDVCPAYWTWINQIDTDENTHVFTIPF
jgi:hypothetical protein